MADAFEIKAFTTDPGGAQRPFHLRISGAVKTEAEDEYSCLVHAPALFKRDRAIFGANPEQAFHLALRFVETLLGSRIIVDREGHQIRLSAVQYGPKADDR